MTAVIANDPRVLLWRRLKAAMVLLWLPLVTAALLAVAFTALSQILPPALSAIAIAVAGAITWKCFRSPVTRIPAEIRPGGTSADGGTSDVGAMSTGLRRTP